MLRRPSLSSVFFIFSFCHSLHALSPIKSSFISSQVTRTRISKFSEKTMGLAVGAFKPCCSSIFSKSMATSISATTVSPYSVDFKPNNVKHSWNPLKHKNGSMSCRFGSESVKLGSRWMEYQGMENWEGLLDPLDDNLRSEILRYGQFVEAAYRSFDFDPSSPSYGTCFYSKNSLFTRSRIGETGYRITKHLRATCGVQLPSWIEKAPSWVSTPSSWIGYVAVCQDKEEIARLGRRDVVIAFRGTATCLEWLENLRATLTYLPGAEVENRDNALPMVETGFLSLYNSKNGNILSLQEMVKEEITKVMKTYSDEPLSFTITGHSLGAALATLAAYDITTSIPNAPLATVISFGGPRVGNKSFRCQLEKSGTKILRIVNSEDLITKVPGFVINNNDVSDRRTDQFQSAFPSWIKKHLKMENTRWVYADVGKELRLSSRESPYLSKGNIATCHELKTYLHLVNGFVSSTCPFKGFHNHHRKKVSV